MIPQQKISLIANNLHKLFGGQRVSENVLERDYCLAWFLTGLSRSKIRENLIFKGGTALRRCYIKDYRFSEDLDFTLKGNIDQEASLNWSRRGLPAN
ncbi:MAG: nucleotidyl transferase AbiEii/AbiGii toxin family protein [Deltaproteobacteria bacterium]|nr:nucleotidyl transferase AbiEii/AbiGii toxin family protein [Deltaproteobacteria bacterium]